MLLFSFGTRPEVIKLFPVIRECRKRAMPFKLLFTGQHPDLFEDVKHLIPDPDYRMHVMDHSQNINNVISKIIKNIDVLLDEVQPSLVIVQGDTTTVLASALAAFYKRIPVAHLEAGIRTHDLSSPFPEEGNRQLVSRIATLNWAPTRIAAGNLEKEGITRVEITGNTIIDACMFYELAVTYENKVLITLHRRENFGLKMRSMFEQINLLARRYPHLDFIFPMHPNPNVQSLKHVLPDVNVCAPLPYEQLLKLLSTCKFVISDSGGLQEECAAFRKKVLVCRNVTGRPEGITAGYAKLVDTQILEHFDWANDAPEWQGENPYGEGNARVKIVDSILHSGILDPY